MTDKIQLESCRYGCFILRRPNTTGEENTLFFQSDWDYPSLAGNFGWQPCHNATDGTVNCPVCGKTASEMIAEAYDFLIDHDGEIVDNPGYAFPDEGDN